MTYGTKIIVEKWAQSGEEIVRPTKLILSITLPLLIGSKDDIFRDIVLIVHFAAFADEKLNAI